MKKNKYFKKTFFMVLGITIFGLGVAFCKISDVGSDCYSAFNFAMSEVTHLSFGITILITNLLLFIPMIIFARNKINVGTAFNMIVMGFITDGFIALYNLLGIEELNIGVRIIVSAIGVLLEAFGLAMYIEADFGISSYDSISLILEEKVKIKYRYARIMVDALFVIPAFIISNIILKDNLVGAFTLITVISVGPIAGWFRKILSSKIRGSEVE